MGPFLEFCIWHKPSSPREDNCCAFRVSLKSIGYRSATSWFTLRRIISTGGPVFVIVEDIFLSILQHIESVTSPAAPDILLRPVILSLLTCVTLELWFWWGSTSFPITPNIIFVPTSATTCQRRNSVSNNMFLILDHYFHLKTGKPAHCISKALTTMKFSFFALSACLPAAFAAFGVTTSGNNLLVDSGAGLVTTSMPNGLSFLMLSDIWHTL